MSGATKFSIAAIFSLVIIIGGVIALLLLSSPEGEPRAADEPSPPVASEPATTAPVEVARVEPAPAVDTATPVDGPASSDGEIPLAPPPALIRDRWLLTGRIVQRDPDAAADSPAIVPAAKVTVFFKPHPRRDRMAGGLPSPQRCVTGDDGRFAFVGVPPETWLRMEVDADDHAYRTLSFKLSAPEWKGEQDLGDILIEPSRDFRVRIVGPGDEPVLGAEVLVGRRKDERSVSLDAANMKESRRGATELGEGLYALERAWPGPQLRVQVRAPGYRRFREYVDVPETGEALVRLEEGLSIAGAVQTLDGDPIPGAELEIDGPNIGSPLPVAEADDEGRFAFEVLSDGEYDVDVRAEGYVATDLKDITAGVEEVVFSLAKESVFAGKVVTADGAPLEGAEISLRHDRGRTWDGRTNAEGAFELHNLQGGFYVVKVTHHAWVDYLENGLEIPAETRVDDRVIELGRGLAVTGTVVDAETEGPIEGALVKLRQSGVSSSERIETKNETGADGAFTLQGLVEGEFTVSVKAEGYLPDRTQTVTLVEGDEPELRLVLQRGAEITGRILDSAGVPVPGATVELAQVTPRTQPQGAPQVMTPGGAVVVSGRSTMNIRAPNVNTSIVKALSDLEGRYSLAGIVAGTGYRVTARHLDFTSTTSEPIDLELGARVDNVDLVLSRGATIRGRVLDPSGTPLASARVSASPQSQQFSFDPENPEANQAAMEQMALMRLGSGSTPTVRTDEEGRYTLTRLSEGTYTVSSRMDGRISGSVDNIEVAGEGVVEGVDVVLEPGQVVAGVVQDVSGDPIPGADVRATNVSSGTERTSLDGRFELLGLPAGEAQIQVSKTGFVTQVVTVTAPDENVYVTLEVAATIRGVVTVQGTGDPIEDARISLRLPPDVDRSTLPQNLRLPSAQSRSDGTFTMREVPSGSFELFVYHDRYAPATVPLGVVAAGEERDVPIELGRGGVVRGLVLGGGAPLANGRVSVFMQDPQNRQPVNKNAQTDAEGRYVIEGLPTGDYTVNARGPNPMFAQTSQQAGIVEGQESVVDFDLAPTIRVYGVVTAGGQGVANARLRFNGLGGGGPGASARTDAAGRYEAWLAGSGSYAFQISLPGGGSGSGGQLTIPDGATELAHDIPLAAGSIVGVVVDAAGVAVPRANVLLQPSASRDLQSFFAAMSGRARSDDQGRFTIGFLESGTYTLQANAAGFAPAVVADVRVDDRGAPTELRITLEKGGSIVARVLDESGQPVARAFALVTDTSGGPLQLARAPVSNDAGEMVIDGIMPGTYDVTIVHQQYAPARHQVELAGETAEAVFRVSPGGEVVVTVTDAGRAPIQGASVELLDAGGASAFGGLLQLVRGNRPQQSDAEGLVVLQNVPAGDYQLVARKDGKTSRPVKIAVKEGRVTEERVPIR